ncbi:MAG: hypothetical protein ACKV19_19240 [Verrucomicrobiales bacterium]
MSGIMTIFSRLFLVLVAWPAEAMAATFAFSLTPEGTRLTGNIGITAAATGSLLGDYESETNPSGTRTKPGLFGSFGSTENVAVPVDLIPGLNGPVNSVPGGAFQLQLNAEAGTVVLSGLTLDLLPGGPLTIPSTVTLEYNTFRTRSPSSLFIGGFPLSVPLGENQLTALAAAQIGSAAGEATPAGINLWDFSISTLLLISGSFEGLLGAAPLPPIPVPYTLNGQIRVDGDGESAHVTASSGFDFSNSTDLGLDLPALPFGLPTLLPPGGTAIVVLDLSLSSLSAELSSTLSIAAPGRVIPEPGAALVACGLFWTSLRRRRVI